MSRYVIQDRYEDGGWDERPDMCPTLDVAIALVGEDSECQIVRIPDGEVVWRSAVPGVWVVEVNCETHVGGIKTRVWRMMCPSNEGPYRYSTRDDAEGDMRMCYPDQIVGTDVRVRQLRGSGI